MLERHQMVKNFYVSAKRRFVRIVKKPTRHGTADKIKG
jgi:hypothetical protein